MNDKMSDKNLMTYCFANSLMYSKRQNNVLCHVLYILSYICDRKKSLLSTFFTLHL